MDAQKDPGRNVVSQQNSDYPRSSLIGKFFRRLADFFDRLASGASARHESQSAALQQASVLSRIRSEVDIITLCLLGVGLVTAGTFIHGWFFFFWNLAFAVFFCTLVWIIFSSVRWRIEARFFLIAFILILSAAAAIERTVAMLAFILLFSMFLYGWRVGVDFIRKEMVSVATVALLCFSSYSLFASVLEWRRTASLHLSGELQMECGSSLAAGMNEASHNSCQVLGTAFDVAEFWQRGGDSNFVRDIAAITNLRTYQDSATDNTIAFAAYSNSPEQLMQAITNYLTAQKGFLRSWLPAAGGGTGRDPLVPQQLMKAADVQLFAVHYESMTRPGYLGGSSAFNALILLHQRRGITWLFIVDGTDLSGREFLLHRIISGFH